MKTIQQIEKLINEVTQRIKSEQKPTDYECYLGKVKHKQGDMQIFLVFTSKHEGVFFDKTEYSNKEYDI